ncbi:hypothetical protein SUDANB121_01766 [Nocardiopsis dassonvillei]|uniref:hypothetical protein n=1 Tax=Nocardiopsis dassonvillei TaxID=2014 RepID=UPI003F54BC11
MSGAEPAPLHSGRAFLGCLLTALLGPLLAAAVFFAGFSLLAPEPRDPGPGPSEPLVLPVEDRPVATAPVEEVTAPVEEFGAPAEDFEAPVSDAP